MYRLRYAYPFTVVSMIQCNRKVCIAEFIHVFLLYKNLIFRRVLFMSNAFDVLDGVMGNNSSANNI